MNINPKKDARAAGSRENALQMGGRALGIPAAGKGRTEGREAGIPETEVPAAGIKEAEALPAAAAPEAEDVPLPAVFPYRLRI